MRRRKLSVEEKVFLIQNYYELRGDKVAVHKAFDREFKIESTKAIRRLIERMVTRFESTASLAEDFYFEVGTIIKEEPKEVVPRKKQKTEPVKDEIKDEEENADDASAEEMTIKVEPEAIAWNVEPTWDAWSNSDDKQSEEEEELFPQPKRARRKKKPVNYAEENEDTTEDTVASVAKTPNLIICQVCGKMFPTRKGYYKHHEIAHMPWKYICTICEKPCSTSANRKEHEETHKGKSERQREEKGKLCTICGEVVFGLKRAMSRHLSEKHSDLPKPERSRNYICNICGKGLMSQDGLRAHLKAHSGQKDYACKYCGKEFSTTSGLILHIRTHTGERPYKCEYCDSAFADCSTRKVHYRQHTGETPYACIFCGKSCKQMQNLRSHYRHIHKEEVAAGKVPGVRL